MISHGINEIMQIYIYSDVITYISSRKRFRQETLSGIQCLKRPISPKSNIALSFCIKQSNAICAVFLEGVFYS